MATEKKVVKTAPKKAVKAEAPKAEKTEKAEKAVKAIKPVKAEAKAAKPTEKAVSVKEEAKAVKEEKPVKAEKKAKEEAKVEKPAVTQAIAFSRDIRVTPRKIRLVIDLIRGKDVSEALAILGNVNRSGSQPVIKTIKSAAANAANNFGMDKNALYISEIQVADGVRIKRFLPRAKGSASQLFKRNSNLRVVVKERK